MERVLGHTCLAGNKREAEIIEHSADRHVVHIVGTSPEFNSNSLQLIALVNDNGSATVSRLDVATAGTRRVSRATIVIRPKATQRSALFTGI